MAGINNYREPSTAPQADRWYNLTLGSSFRDDNPSKFCTLRYDFKPASIDKNQRGTLHKAKDNKVTVEFQNIQPGKPKVIFEGTSEDYKDNDAVLFFDGESFRLERLHRAVKRLRHNRTLGEASAGGGSSATGHSSDANSPPVGGKPTKPHNLHLNKDSYHHHPVEVERIEIGDLKTSDAKPVAEDKTTVPVVDSKKDDDHDHDQDQDQDEPLDIMNHDDEDDEFINAATGIVKEHDFDINKQPNHGDTDEDETADILATSDGEEAGKGTDAAEELRARLNNDNARGGNGNNGSTSSSSGSSDSSRSGSGSGSSSSGSGTSSSSGSDSESSDAES
ncbi:hypothetical protein M569_14358, partial [Genlisea aurea]